MSTKERFLLAAFLVATQFRELRATEAPQAKRPVKDYDAPYALGARAAIADAHTPSSSRVAAMGELIDRDVEQAPSVLAEVISDRDPTVGRRATEWLALLGDRRGLEVQEHCLGNLTCSGRHHAARLLGASGDVRYAPLLAEQVRRALERNFQDGRWQGSDEERAVFYSSTLALARLGRPEDHKIVLEAVKRRPYGDTGFLEALGFIDEPESRQILWDALKKLERPSSCDEAGLGVAALVPLSRLGEPAAIQRMKDILKGAGTPPDHIAPDGSPSLCIDRAQAFEALRPRDATPFAEAVLEVAAQIPEGPGTREAWRALGVMHPSALADRVLKLAVSKEHWQFASRELLNNVIIAIDPDSNQAFWEAFPKVEIVPLQSGHQKLVRRGLGRLMFTGSYYWFGE